MGNGKRLAGRWTLAAALSLALGPALAQGPGQAMPGQAAPDAGAKPHYSVGDLVQALGGTVVEERRFRDLIVKAYVCQALAQDSVAPCGALSNLRMGAPADRVCRQHAMEGLMALTGMQDTGMIATCQQVTQEGGEFKPGTEGLVCGAWADALKSGDADFCASVFRYVGDKHRSRFPEHCRQGTAFLRGPSACRGLDNPTAAAFCGDFSLLIRARVDPAACGNSLLCGAATRHDPSRCQSLSDAALSSFLNDPKLPENLAALRDEIKVRMRYGLPLADAQSHPIADTIEKEQEYREQSGAPPYKAGEPFMWTMTGPQRQLYLDMLKARGRKGKRGDSSQDEQEQ